MIMNLLRRIDPAGRLVAELKAEQKSPKESISQDELPFDVSAELGEVLHAELKSPGVYFLSTKEKEVFVVTKEAPAISEKARSYGQELSGYSDLRVYDIHQPGSGRHVIDFEILRYQIKCHLPIEEREDSLLVASYYGMEEHPDYFGTYPVPQYTPSGCTVRYKALLNGVYWLETNRCEEMLAVCYPIWQSDISIPEQRQGEQLEYDQLHGIDNTLGYLFFSKQNSIIPLYELSHLYPEIAGTIDMAALLNAICENYPEYVAIHNEEASKFEHGNLIKETPDAGIKFFMF